MTSDTDGRAGVGTSNEIQFEEPTKTPGNGQVAFGICFWGYLDRNLSDTSDFSSYMHRLYHHPLLILNPFLPLALSLFLSLYLSLTPLYFLVLSLFLRNKVARERERNNTIPQDLIAIAISNS